MRYPKFVFKILACRLLPTINWVAPKVFQRPVRGFPNQARYAVFGNKVVIRLLYAPHDDYLADNPMYAIL